VNSLDSIDEPRRRLDPFIFRGGFLESLSEGVLLVDVDGKIVDLNTKAAAVLGRAIDGLLESNLSASDWRFVREDGSSLPTGESPVMDTLKTGESHSDMMIGIDVPDLARRWMQVNTRPLRFDGQIKGSVVTFDDVTARKHGEQRLRLLLEVSRLLTSVIDDADFLQSVCNALVDVGGYAMARIYLANHDDQHSVQTVFFAGFAGYSQDDVNSWAAFDAIGQSLSGIALRTGLTQVANNFDADPDFAPWRDLAASLGVASSVAVPFGLGKRTVALAVYGRYIDAFDETTVKGLEEIAREAEFGAEFVRSVQQLATALDGTISALCQMTEARDPYTAGHQVRVGALSEKIAVELGLDVELATLIRQSGSLHDVGKIAIPTEILSHPGRLTDLEFSMVKTHTSIGYDILSRASLPWPIAEVALQHHERLDGSGYPNALRGDEIILPARIIAVADVVEAMTQHRPYRAALGLDMALDEVTKGAGTLFDPDVVKACLAVFAAGFVLSLGP